MIGVLVFSAVVCAGCIYMVLRASESHSKADIALREQMTQERSDWAAERLSLLTQFQAREAELLNRIKPESAQYPVTPIDLVTPTVPDFEDDEYFTKNFPTATALMQEASQNGLHEDES